VLRRGGVTGFRSAEPLQSNHYIESLVRKFGAGSPFPHKAALPARTEPAPTRSEHAVRQGEQRGSARAHRPRPPAARARAAPSDPVASCEALSREEPQHGEQRGEQHTRTPTERWAARLARQLQPEARRAQRAASGCVPGSRSPRRAAGSPCACDLAMQCIQCAHAAAGCPVAAAPGTLEAHSCCRACALFRRRSLRPCPVERIPRIREPQRVSQGGG
jgi:hypothetical protein